MPGSPAEGRARWRSPAPLTKTRAGLQRPPITVGLPRQRTLYTQGLGASVAEARFGHGCAA